MDVRGQGELTKNYPGHKIFCSSINFGLKPSLGFKHGYKVGTSIRNSCWLVNMAPHIRELPHCPLQQWVQAFPCSRRCRTTTPERATHAHPLHPAALASVSYGKVLVRVRVPCSCKSALFFCGNGRKGPRRPHKKLFWWKTILILPQFWLETVIGFHA